MFSSAARFKARPASVAAGACFTLSLLQPHVIHAQAPATTGPTTASDHVFGGVLLMYSDNVRNRVSFGNADTEGVPWQIEGGLTITPRLRLAGELSFWGRRSSLRAFPSNLTRDRQTEKVAQATARYLVADTPRLGLYAIGGAGVLFDDYEVTVTTACEIPPPGPLCDFVYPQPQRRFATFTAGAEVAVRLVPHLDVAGTMRWMSLARPDRRSGASRDDAQRSGAIWLGIGPRVVW
jgi:hypothetical protein